LISVYFLRDYNDFSFEDEQHDLVLIQFTLKQLPSNQHLKHCSIFYVSFNLHFLWFFHLYLLLNSNSFKFLQLHLHYFHLHFHLNHNNFSFFSTFTKPVFSLANDLVILICFIQVISLNLPSSKAEPLRYLKLELLIYVLVFFQHLYVWTIPYMLVLIDYKFPMRCLTINLNYLDQSFFELWFIPFSFIAQYLKLEILQVQFTVSKLKSCLDFLQHFHFLHFYKLTSSCANLCFYLFNQFHN